MSHVPRSVPTVVVGAGIHRILTGWHLGLALAATA
jgi:hypothetical protein